ncbi:MAG: T9SS type A sorting domain-containing protein [Bacteroidota bacterium]
MKLTTNLCKVIFFSLILFACKDVRAFGDPPIYTNWYNSKLEYSNPGICVSLASDNALIFDARVHFADNQIQNYPPMMFYVNLPLEGVSFFTSSVKPQDVYAIQKHGQTFYEASFLIDLDMNAFCAAYNDNFCYNLEIQLVTDYDLNYPNMVVSYPYADHPGLFPPAVFDITGNGGRSNYYIKTKEMCCFNFDPATANDPCAGQGGTAVINNAASPFNPPPPPGALVANPNNIHSVTGTPLSGSAEKSSGTSTANMEATVSPNPFSDELNISFNLRKGEQARVEIMDLQGRLVSARDLTVLYTGQQHINFQSSTWTTGVYIVKIRTRDDIFTYRIIKS